jgi:hypothetical protein
MSRIRRMHLTSRRCASSSGVGLLLPLVGVGGSEKLKPEPDALRGLGPARLLRLALLKLRPPVPLLERPRLRPRPMLLAVLAVLATLEALPSMALDEDCCSDLGDGCGAGVSREAIQGSPAGAGGAPRALMHSLAFFTSC